MTGGLAPVLGRVAGLVALLWLAFAVMRKGLQPAPGGFLWFMHGVNLVFHEAGHVLFIPFGEFMQVAGGSLLQVIVPAVCAGTFFATRQPGAAAVGLFWTGESIADVAVYAADGRSRALPLLAEGMIHDWNYLLGRVHSLDHAERVGQALFMAGVLTMVAALVLLTLELLRAWHDFRFPRSVDTGECPPVE
jgi:hypothetical protein